MVKVLPYKLCNNFQILQVLHSSKFDFTPILSEFLLMYYGSLLLYLIDHKPQNAIITGSPRRKHWCMNHYQGLITQ